MVNHSISPILGDGDLGDLVYRLFNKEVHLPPLEFLEVVDKGKLVHPRAYEVFVSDELKSKIIGLVVAARDNHKKQGLFKSFFDDKNLEGAKASCELKMIATLVNEIAQDKPELGLSNLTAVTIFRLVRDIMDGKMNDKEGNPIVEPFTNEERAHVFGILENVHTSINPKTKESILGESSKKLEDRFSANFDKTLFTNAFRNPILYLPNGKAYARYEVLTKEASNIVEESVKTFLRDEKNYKELSKRPELIFAMQGVIKRESGKTEFMDLGLA